jgi:hypothetical protein
MDFPWFNGRSKMGIISRKEEELSLCIYLIYEP